MSKLLLPKLSHWLRWGLVAVIQLLLISLPLADRLWLQFNGREITLATTPIDPRDLLRGDYVIINLELTNLPVSLPGGSSDFQRGSEIYVELEVDADGIARAKRVDRQLPKGASLVLAGKVSRVLADTIRIDYGLDTFFVPEGTGKAIEQLPRDRVQLVAVVDAQGNAMPLRLLIDGKPFDSDLSF